MNVLNTVTNLVNFNGFGKNGKKREAFFVRKCKPNYMEKNGGIYLTQK